MNKKIAIIHPEGNILYNANLLGMVEIFSEKGYSVDIYCPKMGIAQHSPCSPARMVFYNHAERFVGGIGIAKLRFVRRVLKTVRTFDEARLCERGVDADLIIGVDREGVILAAKLARMKKIPYGLISYEIFFSGETGGDFKAEEIQACRDIDFAVSQDPLRAEKLAEENSIPVGKIIGIPVAGRRVEKGGKQFFLHDALGISHNRHIVLYMGEGADWTRMPDLLRYSRDWGDDWVLVVHLRYGLTPYMRRILKPYKNSKRIFISSLPVNSCKELTPLLKSADMGVALYQPTYTGPYTGNNLKHLGLSSGKLASYVQNGLPVIVNEIGLWSDSVRACNLGIVVNDKIDLPPPDELERYRERCYRFFEEKLDLNKTITPLLDKIAAVLSGSGEA